MRNWYGFGDIKMKTEEETLNEMKSFVQLPSKQCSAKQFGCCVYHDIIIHIFELEARSFL